MDFNKLSGKIHANAVAKGFWDNNPSNEHFLCLVITELSEAVEADRQGNYCCGKISSTDRYNHFPTEEPRFKKEFSAFIKDTVEDEIADAFIRLLDLFGARKIDLNHDCLSSEVIDEYAVNYQQKSFTESIFYIIRFISECSSSIGTSVMVPEMILLEILGLCKHRNIDLFWHVEHKMKYNQSRKRMHGKNY